MVELVFFSESMKLKLFLLVLVMVTLVKAQEKPRYVPVYLNDGEI
jgi:hypothetical protein